MAGHDAVKLLFFCEMLCATKRLHGGFAETVFAGMWPVFIVLRDPCVYIALQLFQAGVQPFPERDAIELVLHGAMKALADAVGLRRPRLGFGVVDILDRQVELVFVMLPLAAKLRAAVCQDA